MRHVAGAVGDQAQAEETDAEPPAQDRVVGVLVQRPAVLAEELQVLVRDIGHRPECLGVDPLAPVERHVVEIIAVLRHAERSRRAVGRQQDPVARRVFGDLRAGREQGLRAVEQPARDPLVVRADRVQQHAEVQGNHVHVQPAEDFVFDHRDHEPRVEDFGGGRDAQFAFQLLVGHDGNPRGLRAPQVDRHAVGKLMIYRSQHSFPRRHGRALPAGLAVNEDVAAIHRLYFW